MRKPVILTMLLLLCFCLPVKAQNFETLEKNDVPENAAAPAADTAAPNDACGDDPRLENELLGLINSNAPINPPLTVTPETFLNMDSEILQVLGGQMIICPNIPVLKSGRPMKKVLADFESIWDNARKAAIAGDDARLKQVLTGFTARPKTAQEIITLLSPVELDDATRNTLYKAAGIEMPKERGERLLIDFYKAVGGKSRDKTPVIVHPNFNSISPDLKEKMGNYIDHNISGNSSVRDFLVDKLRMVGVNAIPS